MHQVKKGNEWHFGMKAHIGVDAKSGLIHSRHRHCRQRGRHHPSPRTAARRGEEAYADAGYIGVEKREEIVTRHSALQWYVAAKRSKVKALAEGRVKELTLLFEKTKAQVRARVEHPFHVVKNLFRHRKVRYRGLRKNTAQLHSLFALANLFLARRSLLNPVQA